MDPKFKRKRLLVDPAFQYRMLARMLVYVFVFIFIVLHLSFLFELMVLLGNMRVPEGGIGGLYVSFLEQQKHILGALLLIAPIIVYDLLKFSNRFAGPLFRVRRMMRDMAKGKTVPEFAPRERDLMKDFFHDFNCLIKEWNARVGPGANGHVNGAVVMPPQANPSNSEPHAELVGQA